MMLQDILDKMDIEIDFCLGDIVYLKTDKEQLPRIVTELGIRPNHVVYRLSCGNDCSYHEDIEISSKKDILLSISN